MNPGLAVRLPLIALGLSYLVSLAWKRLKGQRNRDPRQARLESMQLFGFGGGLLSVGLAWVSMQLHAPLPVDYLFIAGFLGGMLLSVIAYLLASRL